MDIKPTFESDFKWLFPPGSGRQGKGGSLFKRLAPAERVCVCLGGGGGGGVGGAEEATKNRCPQRCLGQVLSAPTFSFFLSFGPA